MGVYIKDMEMPKSCFECLFMIHRCFCLVNPKIEFTDEEYSELKGRYIGCPLVDVPATHGDLIDAFAFRREMDANYPFDKFTQRKHGEADAAKSTILRMLVKAPTIIEAEEET